MNSLHGAAHRHLLANLNWIQVVLPERRKWRASFIGSEGERRQAFLVEQGDDGIIRPPVTRTVFKNSVRTGRGGGGLSCADNSAAPLHESADEHRHLHHLCHDEVRVFGFWRGKFGKMRHR